MGKKPVAKGSVPIHRHQEPLEPTQMASYESRYLEDIDQHILKHIGQQGDVLHEILSPTVHLDLHIIKPNEKIPYLTLITSGMSDLDMVVREGTENPDEYQLAEMITFLPPDWPIEAFAGTGSEGSENLKGWYPAGLMKYHARAVHERKYALSWYHTVANGDPAEPIEEGVGMVGFLMAPPLQLGQEGFFIPTHDGREIRLLNLVPIWPDEVVYAINKGGSALCDKLDRVENFIFDPNRKSCLKRKKIFGLF